MPGVLGLSKRTGPGRHLLSTFNKLEDRLPQQLISTALTTPSAGKTTARVVPNINAPPLSTDEEDNDSPPAKPSGGRKQLITNSPLEDSSGDERARKAGIKRTQFTSSSRPPRRKTEGISEDEGESTTSARDKYSGSSALPLIKRQRVGSSPNDTEPKSSQTRYNGSARTPAGTEDTSKIFGPKPPKARQTYVTKSKKSVQGLGMSYDIQFILVEHSY